MATTVPFKTQLGQDELKSRAHKLGQRHRTLLFLIDGRRPLAEVLSLAQQAGAATHHFEDLLRLGLVELPPDPTPPAAAPTPPADEEAALTSVELVVPGEGEPVVTTPAPLVEVPAVVIDHAVASQVPIIEAPVLDEVAVESPLRRVPVLDAPLAFSDLPPPEVAQVADAALAAITQRADADPAPLSVPVLHAVHEASLKPHAATPLPVLDQAAEPGLDITLPLPDPNEARLLQQVRDLLTDTLRIDAPVFSARTFVRVRNAQSVNELIELVWEIQDHMSAKRRTRRELQSLQRARELLGLGNTLVAEDSRTDYRE